MSTQQRVNRIKSRQESLKFKSKCYATTPVPPYECVGIRIFSIKDAPDSLKEALSQIGLNQNLKTHTSKKVLSFSQYVEEVKEAENELELYFIMKQFQENENRFNEKQIFFIKEQFEERNHEFEVEAVKNRM